VDTIKKIPAKAGPAQLAATLSPDLVPLLERPRPPKKAVGEIFHSGGRI
jgi:hypothetical protein